MDEPGIVLVEGGPLGLCENRGFQVALYGLFFLRDDGRRVWGKPLSIEIEPVKPEAEEA